MSKTLTPAEVLKGPSPLILTAALEPVAGDRFQPAGFPEIGHVIYEAPRKNGTVEQVCIVDSAASMANHLESVCQRGAHDLDLVEELDGLPYLRCVTNHAEGAEPTKDREVVVTSLTEGHRIASSYFLDGCRINGEAKADGKFDQYLISEFGIVLPKGKKAHPPASQWWKVFETIFALDPNSLVHGVLFPQWQIKIPRALTAHLEAFGAARVDRSGVKFDRLGKTTSGQPIFAVDDSTAQSIRATFVLDVGLIRSFGRKKGNDQLGLSDKQQELLVALALWKVQKLLDAPFRYRSGCHLRRSLLQSEGEDIVLAMNIEEAIKSADFDKEPITDVFWPREELYREGADSGDKPDEDDAEVEDDA
jgi:CRISPR-associated protein Csb1